MTKVEKILFISRDPGGTNQLVELRDILLGQAGATRDRLLDQLDLSCTPEITLIAKDYAEDIWRQNGIEVHVWPDLKSEQDIEDYLAGFDPDQIITSTCHADDRTEQAVWRRARRLGVKTTAFLDCGLNIPVRFTNDQGAVFLPDRVFVTEAETIRPLRSLGLDRRAIFISGDLYGRYVKRIAGSNVTGKLRADWGLREGESLILFASDYIREMQARGVAYEITEFECLDCLIDLLKSGNISEYLHDVSRPYRLVIRPHPKDTPGKYEEYPAKSCEDLTILVNNMGSSTDAILSSNVVASLGSSLLKEARTLGVRDLELGPVVRRCKDHEKTVS